MDQRHTNRLHIVQNLFSLSFHGEESKKTVPYKKDEVTPIIMKHLKEIDAHIQKHAPKFPLDKIAKIDICILRLAIFELIIDKKQPVKVIINEAIELAKELGNDRSFAFINAVLGSIHTDLSSLNQSI